MTIIYLSLDSLPEDSKDLVETFSFNPELQEATLKLNGMHKGTIPALTVPIAFDRFKEFDNACIENFQSELDKYTELGQLEKVDILEVLVCDANKSLILESIKEYHRNILLQNIKEAKEQEAEEKRKHHHYEYENLKQEQQDEEYRTISVSEALREKFGTWHVQGTIIGISKMFNMVSKFSFKCMNCGVLNEVPLPYPEFDTPSKQSCKVCGEYGRNNINPEWVSTIIVELQDTDKFYYMDRMSVYLFEKDTIDVRVGESVLITGDIQIDKNSNGKYFANLYGDPIRECIQYLNKKDFSLTESDEQEIKHLVARVGPEHIIEELVNRFCPSIIGYEHPKQGVLLAAANSSETTSKKQKINELFVGDPGLAKSEIIKRGTELVNGSNFISAQNAASGKSLLAIIDKINDNLFLRVGPVTQAKSAICALNELGRLSMKDQGHLLDVMQEEEFTETSYGFNVKIKAPTTILASANPIGNSRWKDDDKIDLNELPILGVLWDRFDLAFIFRTRKNPDDIREFYRKYSEMLAKKERGELPDYTSFLIKYLEYARRLKPVISEEANNMLCNYATDIRIKGFGSDRILPRLHKIIKAIARLKLKEVADELDAKDVMKFYNVMLLEFQKSIAVSQSLRDIAYKECELFLKEHKAYPYKLEELFITVCKRNKQIASYFGYDKGKSLKIADNKKTHSVYDMLSNNHSNIKIVQQNPIVLQWFEPDPSDLSDLPSNTDNKNFSNPEPKHEQQEPVYSGVQFGKDGPINISSTPKSQGHIGQVGQIDHEEEGPYNY